jgi:hypothetical protein
MVYNIAEKMFSDFHDPVVGECLKNACNFNSFWIVSLTNNATTGHMIVQRRLDILLFRSFIVNDHIFIILDCYKITHFQLTAS